MSKKPTQQLSFFDYSRRMEKIAEFDRLPVLNDLVPWEMFRKRLESVTRKSREPSVGGRPAFDAVKMFKILVLQRLYSLSDEALEFRVNDSLSFQRFVGLGQQELVPDAKTIWLFREQLTQSDGVIEELFGQFEEYLSSRGFKASGGTIVDASIVRVPEKKLGNKAEYQEIKEGKTPESWKGTLSKQRQLDRDARFTNRRGMSLYGYKNHVNVDVAYKLIRQATVTASNVNECLVMDKLLNQRNRCKDVYGDSAYDTLRIKQLVTSLDLRSQIQKQRRGSAMPLNKYTKYNAKRSPTRKRIEHVFGHQAVSMKANLIRCVGIVRARGTILLNNLVYSMSRYRFLAVAHAKA